MSTFEALCKILVRDYAVAAESLTPDTTLASLAIDSLGVIELIFEIEETFKVSVPDGDADMARDFGTLAELSHYVDQLIAASDGPAAAEPAAAAEEAGFTNRS
jgi:acyl carrier protein